MLSKYMFTTQDRIAIAEYYLSNGLDETVRAVALTEKNISRATVFRYVQK